MHMQFMQPVRAHCHTVTCRSLGDAAPFRNAPANCSVSLQDRGGALIENFFEAPAACLDFAGSHVDRTTGGESSVIFQIVRAEGLLDPIRRVFLIALAVK